jgi:Flp pilus assembly protein TadD
MVVRNCRLSPGGGFRPGEYLVFNGLLDEEESAINEGIDALTEGANLPNPSIACLMDLGWILSSRGLDSLALPYLRRATELAPDSRDILSLKALAEIRVGKREEAIASLTRAVGFVNATDSDRAWLSTLREGADLKALRKEAVLRKIGFGDPDLARHTPAEQAKAAVHLLKAVYDRDPADMSAAYHLAYNVQSAVDTKHHLIVTHEVTNVGSDRSQLSRMSEQARAAIGSETIEAVADRGYYSGEEIVACEQAGVTVYLPKPMTSGLLAKGRFGKQDFVYVAADDVYLCPSGEQLTYHYTNEEDGKTLRRYWTNACRGCALKSQCTTGKERRISRWEHEAVLEAVQARLDRNPHKMRERRQTVEHPFGTIKSWMGATHFQMRTLKHVGTEMALHVLAYNMKRLMHILGVGGLIEAIRA